MFRSSIDDLQKLIDESLGFRVQVMLLMLSDIFSNKFFFNHYTIIVINICFFLHKFQLTNYIYVSYTI